MSTIAAQLNVGDYVSLSQLLFIPLTLYAARERECDTALKQFLLFQLVRIAVFVWPVRLRGLWRRAQRHEHKGDKVRDEAQDKWDSLAAFLGFKGHIVGILSGLIGGMWLIQESRCEWKDKSVGQATLWTLFMIVQGY